MTPEPDYLAMLRTLSEHQVDFIVVGGVCAVLHGSPIATFDLDVVHSRADENLDAVYREPAHRKVKPTRSHLASEGHQLLMTRAGPLDLLGTIGTGRGYAELLQHTVEMQLRGGVTVRLLDLETLIQVKEEADRDKDRAVLAILRHTLEEKTKG